MSTTVTYKGNTLATVSNNTKTLKTAGKYMEGDVTLTDTSSTIVVSETLDANGGIIKTITTTDEVNLQTKTITPTSSVQTVNPDTGYDGFSQVTVNASTGGSGVDIPVFTWVNDTGVTTCNKTFSEIQAYFNEYNNCAMLINNSEYGDVTYSVVFSNYDDWDSPTYATLFAVTDSGPNLSFKYYANGTITTPDVYEFYEFPTFAQNGDYYPSNGKAFGSVTVAVPSGTPTLQNKTVTPTTSQQTVQADSGYDGLDTVTVNAMPSGTAGTPTATKGTVSNHSISVTPSVTNTTGYITGSTKTGTAVIVTASELASGNKAITQNGTGIDVVGYSTVSVAVPTGSTINNQNKTVTPSESIQSITADSGYTGLGTVTVNGIPFDYVGSGIDQLDSSDLTVSGGTVTVPAGYYENGASKSVATMTLPTAAASSATSGYTSKATIGRSTAAQYINIPPGYNSTGAYYVISAVANGSATGPSSLSGSSATITIGTNTITLTKTGVTTTPTVSAGYVSSATASTATVALTASVTVNPTPTASGATVTIPAGYYSSQTTKSVTSGSATAPSTISGTAASVSTGTNTLTLTKTVSVTPTVSAGYVSSGTAGNSSVSLTASVTTKAAATITPTTTNQTIASGTYLTGTQTIAGDADLVGSNILSTANIFGVQGTVDFVDVYIRSAAPTSSVGNDGDIYIQE